MVQFAKKCRTEFGGGNSYSRSPGSRKLSRFLPSLMAAGETDGLELEVMRTYDHSWHPCQVSFSSCISGGFGLIVDFENCNLGDTIYTEEEALARLRIRSVPLQDGDCFHIEEGEHILAMHKTPLRSLFFDAEVEKVNNLSEEGERILAMHTTPLGSLFFEADVEKVWRVRHSLRVNCRCTFSIKWLHPELKGETMYVPPSSIRKLARYSIHSHPCIVAFVNSMNPLHSSSKTASVTLLENTDGKTGLQRLLEEQIEEISKEADAPSKAVPDEILLGVIKGSTQSKAFVASEISSLPDATHSRNNFRRSTWKQRGKKPEMESNDPPLFQPSPEEHFQERSCLSPLAARARLASLMYELPQKPEISIYHVEKEGYLDTSQNTPGEHMNVVSMGVTRVFMNSDICIQENLSVASNDSSVVASMPVASNPIEISNSAFGESMIESRSLVSSRTGTLDMSQLEDSDEAVTLQERSIPMPQILEDRSFNTPTITARFTRSAMNRMSNNTATTTRATRSAIQDTVKETEKVELKPSAKDGYLNSRTVTKKLTRSAIQKELGHSVNEVNMSSSTKNAKPSSHTIMSRITRSANQKKAGKSVEDFEPEPSTKDGNLNSPTMTKRLTRSAIQKELGHSVNEVNMSSSTKDTEPNSRSRTSRITLSTNQKEAGKSVEDFELEPSTKVGNLNIPTMTKRLTRSAIQKEMEHSVNDIRMGSSTKDREPNGTTIMTRITRSANQKAAGKSVNEFKMESSKDGRLNSSATTKLTGLAIQNDMGNSVCEDMPKSSTKGTKLNSPFIPARLTRSASRKGMGNSVKELKLESSTEDRNLSRPAITTRSTLSTSQEGMGNSVNDVRVESSTKERKLSSPTVRTRSTYSAIHREIGTDVDEIKIEERKLCGPPTTTRLTRSAFHREIGSSVDEVKLESTAKDTKLNYPPVTRRLTRSAAEKEKENTTNEAKVDSSTKRRKLNSPLITLLTHFTSKKEIGYSVEEVKLDSSMEDQKLNSTSISSRLTRSAVRRELENTTAKVGTKLKKGKSTQDSWTSDLVEFVTPENKEPKKKRAVFPSSIDAEKNASQGKRKMIKVSSTVIIVNDSEGGISARDKGQISVCSEGQKAKKPQLRFSHRLRFLPRTRSQRKNSSSS